MEKQQIKLKSEITVPITANADPWYPDDDADFLRAAFVLVDALEEASNTAVETTETEPTS